MSLLWQSYKTNNGNLAHTLIDKRIQNQLKYFELYLQQVFFHYSLRKVNGLEVNVVNTAYSEYSRTDHQSQYEELIHI